MRRGLARCGEVWRGSGEDWRGEASHGGRGSARTRRVRWAMVRHAKARLAVPVGQSRVGCGSARTGAAWCRWGVHRRSGLAAAWSGLVGSGRVWRGGHGGHGSAWFAKARRSRFGLAGSAADARGGVRHVRLWSGGHGGAWLGAAWLGVERRSGFARVWSRMARLGRAVMVRSGAARSGRRREG